MKIAEVIETVTAGSNHPDLRVVRMRRSLKEFMEDWRDAANRTLYRVQVLTQASHDEHDAWLTIARSRSEMNAVATARLIANRAKRGGVCGYRCSQAHGENWQDQ